MSILTGVIAFPPDAPKDWGYGPSIKFKAKPANGGDLVVLFCSESHDDAAKLAKGVTVFYQMEGEKAKFMGVDQSQAAKATPAAQPTPTQQSPGQPAKDPVTLGQVTQTWVKIYQHLADTLPDQDEKSRRKSATTVFIAACQQGAFWKE